ncbi:small multi-drug export protein [Lutispora sp.]|uniref:small multi-drug export protein n=1 Tax=Lutispora sp. TaxID=2828727 RepID=UPI002B200211|nr:small multi-drug export protein [Lutispora sp.]MEA4964010.1 small multi-drug export protein [Lutispora sp.]
MLIFVAIPLPGTGVWSGSLAAALLDMRFKWAFPAIFVGNLIAAFIIMTLSNGVMWIFS